MFTVENGKLQHGIFQKRNMPIVAIANVNLQGRNKM
jgi:hypothetical protein